MDVRVGGALVQIRLNGFRHEVPASELRLTRHACDAAVKSAVAEYLDITPQAVSPAQIVRDLSGHLTVWLDTSHSPLSA